MIRLRGIAILASGTMFGAALLGTSCIGGPPLPAIELYRLVPVDTGSVGGPSPASSDAGRPLPGSLAIVRYVTPGVYGEPSIVFRTDAAHYGSYPHREWAVPLGEMLGTLTEKVAARVPLTSDPAFYDPPSARAQNWIWRGTVREFEEVNRSDSVFAAVRLDAQLLRAIDDSVLWSGSAELERHVQRSRDMSAIVETLSALAAEAIAQLLVDARRTVSASAAATAHVPR